MSASILDHATTLTDTSEDLVFETFPQFLQKIKTAVGKDQVNIDVVYTDGGSAGIKFAINGKEKVIWGSTTKFDPSSWGKSSEEQQKALMAHGILECQGNQGKYLVISDMREWREQGSGIQTSVSLTM